MDYLLNFFSFMGMYQAAITAFATIGIFIVAFMTFMENRKLREISTKPRVVAYLEQDSRYVNFLNLSIKNIGYAAAHNVSIWINADKEDFSFHEVRIRNESDRKPIGTFPHGSKIMTELGFGHVLFKEPRLKPFEIVIEFEDMKGKKYRECCLLDISQFGGGLGTLAYPAEHEMAEALKNIGKHIENVSRGGRVRVETMTAAEVIESRNRR